MFTGLALFSVVMMALAIPFINMKESDTSDKKVNPVLTGLTDYLSPRPESDHRTTY